jgi:GT2 family glycosyltransferase/glycosyltransferase involved in cell wall biosynthesis
MARDYGAGRSAREGRGGHDATLLAPTRHHVALGHGRPATARLLPTTPSEVIRDPEDDSPQRALDDVRRGPLSDLRRRIYLTYRYRGLGSLLYRALTFPLRFTPLKRYLRLGADSAEDQAAQRRWYRKRGRPVTIVIPSFRDAEHVAALVASIRKTTDRTRVQIIVCDDASGPEHVAALRAISGVKLILGAENAGFAANVNRGLRAADPSHDVVILNSDVIALPGWLDCLQYATSRSDDVGIVGPKLLYRDGRIQFGGTVRNLGAPEWFDHRYRFKPGNWGPSRIPQPVLAVTGACVYVTRAVIDRIGLLDVSYPMAYEDVDWCLRAWQAGFHVLYWPWAQLQHLESVTRGIEVGERERRSQQTFWGRWGEFFDAREVRSEEGALRVIYVTEDTGVGGGHRDIFEHLNRLLDRGHEVELWTLGHEPDWFHLRAPVRTFEDYHELVQELAPVDAIKVATWWATADPVWEASVLHGIPVYFVQDIETSYYPHSERLRDAVLASYRNEFRYMTISSWNRDRLRELGLDATLIPPGIDLSCFGPRPDVRPRSDMVLALGRSNPLKNLPLTIAAWRSLPEPRPELCLFGIEPELATEPGVRYVESPSDHEVNRLFNEATVFVQTSTHEGFCLPALESMATGGAVVCTDAHGNRDFCVDGENCLMPEPDRRSVTAAVQQLLADLALRGRLGRAGIQTAEDYSWERRIDTLERFLADVAKPRRIAPSTDAVPEAWRIRAR